MRKKTLANAQAEIVTKAAIEASLTGNIGSHTHSLIEFSDGPRNLSDRLPSWKTRSATFDFVNNSIVSGTGNYGGVLTFAP